MECPHLTSNVTPGVDVAKFPHGSPSSWSCTVCRSNKSPWLCLTCLLVHCGRYVNGHAKKHFEDNQVLCSPRKAEKVDKETCHHSVCMDSSSFGVFCYRCDDFVINDTKHVQRVREHLQSLENSALNPDRQKKRKLQDCADLDNKLLKTTDGAALGATGLRNLGNTCFMNAILQSLSNIQQFSSFFKQLPAVGLRSGKKAGRRMYHTRSQGDTSVSLVEEFRKTLCSLWQGNQTAFSPDSLFYTIWKLMPSFRGYQQQDAHEFMRYLLDHLHRELLHSRNGATPPPEGVVVAPADGKCCINGTVSVVTSNFGGILQNEVNCLICGTESRKFDPFLDLSLDIPSQFRQKRSKDQEPGPTCTLGDCLRSFTDLEELDETELYYCHKCKKRQQSTKKFWVQKLPKVLCLHLKRFHWTAFLRNKVDTYVEFPLKGLDMKGYLLEPETPQTGSCVYDLAAIVVHHGSGVGSGHYTAYGSHEGHWYHFNDSTVTQTGEETVRKAKAYILFYVERTDPGERRTDLAEERRTDPAEERTDPAEERTDPAERRSDPAERRADPAERRSDPAERRADPAERRSDPAERRADPAERRSDPAERRVDPAERRTDPAERRADPAERRADPAERRADPAERRADPAERRADPAERRADPAERRADPAERRSDPAERRADPAERRADPAERRADPAEDALTDGSHVKDEPVSTEPLDHTSGDWMDLKEAAPEDGAGTKNEEEPLALF